MTPLGLYVHVPFCASRCGYCDFNTYTAAELPGGGDQAGFAAAATLEIEQAARALGDALRPVSTVFVGGGTPTLLPAEDLVAILGAVRERFGLEDGAEVTTEANPESVDPRSLATLRAGGFTRVSIGMQHAAPHVLATLDREHTPGRAAAAVAEARAEGFEQVSLDLIYGTPGERAEDWALTLETALAAGPDHVSAYGLEVEPGTKLAARVRRGELPVPDGDAMADRQAEADAAFSAAGLTWYEVANHAASPASRCRHNLGYWYSHDWWGVGPGAHSHLDGERWWNVKHPSAYARRLAEGASPRADGESLSGETRRFERIMLEVRLAEGLDLSLLSAAGLAAARRLAADDALVLDGERATLTLRGRLTADAVVRELTD